MKILFTNADQLTTSKMIELQSKVKQEKPLIIAISEVKHKNKSKRFIDEDYSIQDYNLHPVNLDTDTGRGIVVYTHCSIGKSVTQIDIDESFEEVCALEIRLRGGDLLLFCCCNRSPTTSEFSNDNNDKLIHFLQKIGKTKYSHRCILGGYEDGES